MKVRLNIVDKFSTFLSFSDNDKFILSWKTDYKLKINIEKILYQKKIREEILAYEFLINIRLNSQKILQHHLTSYLQEVSYWATKEIYFSLNNILNNLTMEECFLWANEAIIQPEKLLHKYQYDKGSKITTYAQTRLKTIIKDKVYISRGWKLLTNWGLLKKISKSQRQKILIEIVGLKGDSLAEYLLVWQCFIDNYVSFFPHKNKSLSPPSNSQFKIMTNEYNILAKKKFNYSTPLTVEDFKHKVQFCAEKARLFINPLTVEYFEDKEINTNNNPQDYLTFLENSQNNRQINQMLTGNFKNLNMVSQSIFYLGEGFGLTQGKIIEIIQLTHPNFISEQYQLSREIEKIKKFLLDAVIKNLTEEKKKIVKEKIKPLMQILKQWLTEYIEEEIFLLCQESYQEIDIYQQNLLKENYFESSLSNFSFSDNIPPHLMDILREKFNHKLNLKLEKDAINNDIFLLWLEKFFHQYFNQL